MGLVLQSIKLDRGARFMLPCPPLNLAVPGITARIAPSLFDLL